MEAVAFESKQRFQALLAEELRPKPRLKLTLKKLPMWGEQVQADQIDFMWPTQEMLGQMQHDVALESLEFMDSDEGPAISTIRCSLTNGS